MNLSFFNFWNSFLLLLGITVCSLFFDGHSSEPEVINWWGLSIDVILLAPLLETFVFQFIPVRIFFFLIKKPNQWHLLLLIFLSGLIFGLTHMDSLHQVIFSALKGFVLVMLFINTYCAKSLSKAFWFTSGLHALYNLILYLVLFISYHLTVL